MCNFLTCNTDRSNGVRLDSGNEERQSRRRLSFHTNRVCVRYSSRVAPSMQTQTCCAPTDSGVKLSTESSVLEEAGRCTDSQPTLSFIDRSFVSWLVCMYVLQAAARSSWCAAGYFFVCWQWDQVGGDEGERNCENEWWFFAVINSHLSRSIFCNHYSLPPSRLPFPSKRNTRNQVLFNRTRSYWEHQLTKASFFVTCLLAHPLLLHPTASPSASFYNRFGFPKANKQNLFLCITHRLILNAGYYN